MNSKLANKYGKPHNVSTGSCSHSTKAAGRPAINSSVKSGKFLPDAKAGTYGVKGVGK